VTRQDDKTITGIPGLQAIPLLGYLFKGTSLDHNRDDIVIAVIPHIIRKPQLTEENLRAIATGSQVIKVTYGPEQDETGAAPGAPARSAMPPATAPPIGAAAASPATTPTTPATAPPAAVPAAGSPANMPPLGGATPVAAPGVPPATAPPATAPPAITPPSGPALNFGPKTIEAAAGKTFTVSLTADNATDLGSAPVEIRFDPKMVRLNDVAAGDLLAQGGAAPLVIKNIQNEAGTAAIQVSRQPGLKGATGSGAIVTLTFAAVTPGDTQITAPSISLRNSQGQPMGTGSPGMTVHIK
jgi:general secretion pathway protein D